MKTQIDELASQLAILFQDPNTHALWNTDPISILEGVGFTFDTLDKEDLARYSEYLSSLRCQNDKLEMHSL